MGIVPDDYPASTSSLPLSKTEINLVRLLKCCEKQAAGTDDEELKKDPKFHSYVAVLQEQLASLLGEGPQPGLPSISGEKASQYQERIAGLAAKLDRKALPGIWEPLGGDDDQAEDASDVTPASTSYTPEEPSLAAMLRRRAGQRSATKGDVAIGKSRDALNLDDASRLVIEKNRLLQDDLTDQMVELAGRLKANSLLMDSTIQESTKILSNQEVAVEHNIASTRQANARATAIYQKSFCTGCFTWVVIFLFFWAFLGMVVLIRMT